MFRVVLPSATYKHGAPQQAFFNSLTSDLARAPGVDHVAIVTCPPFGCHQGRFYTAEGAAPLSKNDPDPVTLSRWASPDYFATMGIQFVHGRPFREQEGFATSGFRPIVINEELARHLWPGVEDPTGKRMASRGDTSRNWSTVVGVVRDVKHYGLARPMIPGLYYPLTRRDTSTDISSYEVVVHTAGNPTMLFPAVRGAVRALDPDLPVVDLKTAQVALDESLRDSRMLAFALAAFAAIALTLAVGGIYALLSYVVGRRRHEIGIRMALGARQSQVGALVVRQGLSLVAVGLAIGVPVALGSLRVLSSLLTGVAASDPATYATVVILLAGTGALAALVPARRAAALDPKIALSEGS
jgi:putative ABC transport system permease protein